MTQRGEAYALGAGNNLRIGNPGEKILKSYKGLMTHVSRKLRDWESNKQQLFVIDPFGKRRMSASMAINQIARCFIPTSPNWPNVENRSQVL